MSVQTESHADLVAVVEQQQLQLDEQRRDIAALRAQLGGRAAAQPAGRTRRRWAGPLVLTAVGLASVVGVAGAYPTVSTTNVAFVPIPAHTVLSGSVAAGKASSPVVLGGATTVPTNATTVQMIVTAKGTKAGSLIILPAANPTGGSPQSVSWTAGGSVTATVAQNVGYKSEVSFQNTSAATATVTVKLIGYSTQVTAGDIAPTGGSSGQVLTNSGSEVVWQTPNFQSPDTATITVHPGANAATNGTKLLTAVSGIGAGTPTLVRLEAGTYDLGTSTLTLPGKTWIEGAGQGVTTISGSGSPVVNASASNGIELLSVVGTAFECLGVSSPSAVTVQLVDVSGCSNGLQTDGAGTVSVTDAAISSTNGHAVQVDTGTVSIAGSKLVETGSVGSGVFVAGGATATVNASSISGVIFSILVNGTVNVIDTQVTPGPGGTPRCVGDYNASFVALSTSCT